MKKLVLLLAVIAASLIASNFSSFAAKAGYVRRVDGNKKVIVFVHGFIGNADTTWGEQANSWPTLISRDATFAAANIYNYEYPTRFFEEGLSIDEIAEDLRIRLGGDGVLSSDEIIFIAHSMGGLVVRSFLLKNKDYFDKTQFLYFLATPTSGSVLANIGSLVSANPQIRKMKWVDSADFLADLTRQWLAAEPPFPTYCAYEKRRTLGRMVVEFASATQLCTKHLDPINADHIEIAKPQHSLATQYQAFATAYREQANRFPSTKGLEIQYARLFGALEVPLLMKELPSAGFERSVYGPTYRMPRRNRATNNDIQVELANFIHTAPFRDARPLLTPIWRALSGDDLAAVNVAFRASAGDRNERLCFFLEPLVDGGSGYNADIFGQAMPRRWQKACTKIQRDFDQRIGFTFIILENTSKDAIQNVTIGQRSNYADNPVLKTYKNTAREVRLLRPSTLAMSTDNAVFNLVKLYGDAESADKAIQSAPQSELKIARINPGEKFIALLNVYVANNNLLPASYLYGQTKFETITFLIGAVTHTLPIREPYKEKAARVAVPYGWFNQ